MIGYDSDNLSDIPSPSTVQLLLYYNDGESGSATPEQLALFPSAFKQSISRVYGKPAYWGDVEPGCLWPIAQGVAAFQQGYVHGLYVAESNWSALRSAIPSLQPPYWIADELATYPTSPPSIPQSWLDLGCVLWQYALSPGISPGHYDISVAAPGFPGPIPLPAIPKELLMNGPIFDPQGRKHFAGIYPSNGHVIELVETAAGTNQFDWYDQTDNCINGTCPGIS